jgi:hypothetical protein
MDITPALKYAVGITLASKVVPAVIDAGVELLPEPVHTPVKMATDIVKDAIGQLVDITA